MFFYTMILNFNTPPPQLNSKPVLIWYRDYICASERLVKYSIKLYVYRHNINMKIVIFKILLLPFKSFENVGDELMINLYIYLLFLRHYSVSYSYSIELWSSKSEHHYCTCTRITIIAQNLVRKTVCYYYTVVINVWT